MTPKFDNTDPSWRRAPDDNDQLRVGQIGAVLQTLSGEAE